MDPASICKILGQDAASLLGGKSIPMMPGRTTCTTPAATPVNVPPRCPQPCNARQAEANKRRPYPGFNMFSPRATISPRSAPIEQGHQFDRQCLQQPINTINRSCPQLPNQQNQQAQSPCNRQGNQGNQNFTRSIDQGQSSQQPCTSCSPSNRQNQDSRNFSRSSDNSSCQQNQQPQSPYNRQSQGNRNFTRSADDESLLYNSQQQSINIPRFMETGNQQRSQAFSPCGTQRLKPILKNDTNAGPSGKMQTRCSNPPGIRQQLSNDTTCSEYSMANGYPPQVRPPSCLSGKQQQPNNQSAYSTINQSSSFEGRPFRPRDLPSTSNAMYQRNTNQTCDTSYNNEQSSYISLRNQSAQSQFLHTTEERTQFEPIIVVPRNVNIDLPCQPQTRTVTNLQSNTGSQNSLQLQPQRGICGDCSMKRSTTPENSTNRSYQTTESRAAIPCDRSTNSSAASYHTTRNESLQRYCPSCHADLSNQNTMPTCNNEQRQPSYEDMKPLLNSTMYDMDFGNNLPCNQQQSQQPPQVNYSSYGNIPSKVRNFTVHNQSMGNSDPQICPVTRLQYDNCVLDQYSPGLMQDTIDGNEDFNSVVYDVVFGDRKDAPLHPPSIDPMTLLETFSLRIEHERAILNHEPRYTPLKETARPTRMNYGIPDIECHFDNLNKSDLNFSIESLLIAERLMQDQPGGGSLEAEISKSVTMLPDGRSVQLTTYLGKTQRKQ